MKPIPAALILFFLLFAIVAALVFVKLDSLERRLAKVPRSSSIDQRFRDIESSLEALKRDGFKAAQRTEDRLTALETGLGKPVLAGPETVESLITSLRMDHFAFRDVASQNPDRELNLRERMEGTIEKLEQKQENGDEGVLAALFREERTSEDNDWKAYLLREVVWRMGAEAKAELMDFFRNRENSANLRVLAARAVMKVGGRREIKEFAEDLLDRKEDLTVKTGLANLFRDHNTAMAEEGLIEGVRGFAGPGGKAILYAPPHRYACLRALGFIDSPRTIRFLEELITDSCSADPTGEKDPYIAFFAVDAYHRIMGEDCRPLLEELLERNSLSGSPLGEKIQNILDEYRSGRGGKKDAKGSQQKREK